MKKLISALIIVAVPSVGLCGELPNQLPLTCAAKSHDFNLSEFQAVDLKTLKGFLLVSRKAIFSVKNNGIMNFQSEQSFTTFRPSSNEVLVNCGLNPSKSLKGYSIAAPTVVDLRNEQKVSPIVWQFNAIYDGSKFEAKNQMSPLMSRDLASLDSFDDLSKKAKVYKISSNQYALIFNEKDGITEKNLALIYDVIKNI